MGLRVVRGGRRQVGNVNTYVGEFGTIFYDETTGTLRLSDGVTPGGINNVLPVASGTQLGGIKLGPGVTLNGQNQLIIDSAGLDFSFGDFYAFTNNGPSDGACLSSVNVDQDVNIVSNGTGSVNVVGEFNVHKTNNNVEDALSAAPIFKVDADGYTTIRVPTTGSTAGAVEIIGSLSGASQSPVNTGVMLHVTGNNNDASRIYNDAIGSFAAFVARRYNGLAAAPTAVLANEEIMRLSGTAHNGTSLPGTANQRITYKALGNQTLTNQGGSIEFATTPLNSTTLGTVATIDSANGFVVTKATVTGNLIVGNISATGITGTLSNGNSNVSIAANGNVSVSSTGNANVLVVTGTGANIAGTANITGNVTAGNVSATRLTGKLIRNVRDAGTIGAGGTLTIDFSTDAMVYCTWGNGMTLAYQNYTAGSVVKVMATKATGTGNDSLSLGGVTASHVSSGTTSQSYGADVTAFVELISTNTTIGGVYVKL